MTLEPYQQRVVTERSDLHDKIGKLGNFLHSEAAEAVDPAERARMKLQWGIMKEYRDILDARIAAFT